MKKSIIVLMLLLFAIPAISAQKTAANAAKTTTPAPTKSVSGSYPAVQGNFLVSLPLFGLEFGMGKAYKSFEGDMRIDFALGAQGYESEIQYFAIDNLAIGGVFGFSTMKLGEYSETTFEFGPLANYFLDLDMAPIYPYAGAAFLFRNTSRKGQDSTKEMTILRVQAGVVYMLGKNLAAFGQVHFNIDRISQSESAMGEKLGLMAGIKAFF